MDLTEFVKETLTQIVAGVTQAQSGIEEQGGAVAPVFQQGKEQGLTQVDFDVAVVVSSTDTTGGKLQVAFWGLKAGGGASSQASEQTTSRVRFKVPVQLPPGKLGHYWKKARGEA